MDEKGHPISKLRVEVMSDGLIKLCLMDIIMTGDY